MPMFDPEPRIIQVRGDRAMRSKFLFEFYPKTMEIKLKNRDVTFTIKINDLLAFANETDQDVFHIKAIIEDKGDL